MSRLGAIFRFDLLRCRRWLWFWWAFCFLQLAAGVALRYGVPEERLPGLEIGLPLGFLLLAIYVGVIVQPGNPRLPRSFFRTRPVRATELLGARLLLMAGVLLLPLYLAQLLPLLLVEPGFGTASAYTVYFWSLHAGVLALFGALAAASGKTSTYLLRVFFGGALLLLVSALKGRLAKHESAWIAVASPETAALLWQSGVAVLGAVVFVAVLAALYRGRGSWRLGAGAIACALLLAAAWTPVRFVQDPASDVHPVEASLIDIAELRFEAGSPSRSMGSFVNQRNREPGSYSTYVSAAPPYLEDPAERFWFVQGRFEVKGLDPEIAYAARLVDARWVPPDGEVVRYEPPTGTFAVRNSLNTSPPPPPTEAGLDALLGPAPETESEFGPRRADGTELLLFGTWTSVYERFKATPGRLEMRVRVDFYAHSTGPVLPLGEPGFVDARHGVVRLAGVSLVGDELEATVTTLRALKRWRIPMADRWSSQWNWMIHDPATGRRGISSGGSVGNSPLWGSLRRSRERIAFRPDAPIRDLPDLQDFASLRLVSIKPRYLGSAEVDVIVPDFPLVTQKSIDWAYEHDRTLD